MVVNDIFPCAGRGRGVVNVNNLPTASVDSLGELPDNAFETEDFEGGSEDNHHVRIGAQVGGREGPDLFRKGVLFTVEDDIGLSNVRIYVGHIYRWW